ncbi:MAG: YqgE/AlgH family protein [Kiritimatiellia bacterium]
MESTPAPAHTDLTGKVLVASPSLQDPNFRHTLVYIARHTDEGAVGVVMNRPTGKVLGDTGGTGPFPASMAALPLLAGGPVNPTFVTLGVFRPGTTDREWACSFSEPPETIAELLAGGSGAHVRAFVGYAGWSAGQLEQELREDSWRVSDPSRALFNPAWTPNLWACFAADRQIWRDLLDFLPVNAGLN